MQLVLQQNILKSIWDTVIDNIPAFSNKLLSKKQ